MTYTEYEAKFKVRDHGEIERALVKLGASLIDHVFEEDHYIDLYPCIDLKKRDEVLRIRITRSSSNRVSGELTYKGPKKFKDLKVRDEISIEIGDPFKLLDIFGRLGFKNRYVIRKQRKIYRLGTYKIFLDTVESLGRFVEIEVEGVKTASEFVSKIEKLKNIINISGVNIVKSYLELWLEERGKKYSGEKS